MYKGDGEASIEVVEVIEVRRYTEVMSKQVIEVVCRREERGEVKEGERRKEKEGEETSPTSTV
jgi:hypothetical protein